MPFIQGKCPNCGGLLAVNDEQDAAICQFCNMPFVVEKAINYYNTVNNIKADVVNIVGATANEYEIVGGVLVKYNGEQADVVIPENVAAVDSNAFACCRKGIRSVRFLNDNTSISDSCFEDCENLVEIVLPKKMVRIPIDAFRNCSSLKNVDLPDTIQEIWPGAFYGCSLLERITIPEGLKFITVGAFERCDGLKYIKLPSTEYEIWPSKTGLEKFVFSMINDDTELIDPLLSAHIRHGDFYGYLPERIWEQYSKEKPSSGKAGLFKFF